MIGQTKLTSVLHACKRTPKGCFLFKKKRKILLCWSIHECVTIITRLHAWKNSKIIVLKCLWNEKWISNKLNNLKEFLKLYILYTPFTIFPYITLLLRYLVLNYIQINYTYDICSVQAAFVNFLDLGANTLHWQHFFNVFDV